MVIPEKKKKTMGRRSNLQSGVNSLESLFLSYMSVSLKQMVDEDPG